MNEENLIFAPNAIPRIESGKYTIEVSQETNIEGCKLQTASLDFDVRTDRISMNSGEVYSVYPPKDSCGTFGNCLPHIVLHRHTLPWERNIGEKGITWLALLIISEDENAVCESMKYADAKTGPDNILFPKFTGEEEPDPEQICQTITIPYELFADILPTGEDLPYLAHAKGVNLDNKVTDSEVKGEWFSCIIANRYPLTPDTVNGRIKHKAYLVSMEGFEDYIFEPENRSKDLKKYSSVRMYCMYYWSFEVKSNEAFDFYALANQLKADIFQADSTSVKENEPLKKLLNIGYVPMNHYFREGSSSVSWYHSPFIPQKPQWNDNVRYHFLADELLAYDPQNGMFDITYCAAWQLGRLMALQDRDFSRKLLSWRLSNKHQAVQNQMYKLLHNKLCSAELFEAKVSNTKAAAAELCRQTWESNVRDLLDICGKSDGGRSLDACNCKSSDAERNIAGSLKNRLKDYIPLKQEDILDFLKSETKE
ncbi:MAG: hypothetical protein ACM3KR_07145 [Deltaproteobacteria bacterium]